MIISSTRIFKGNYVDNHAHRLRALRPVLTCFWDLSFLVSVWALMSSSFSSCSADMKPMAPGDSSSLCQPLAVPPHAHQERWSQPSTALGKWWCLVNVYQMNRGMGGQMLAVSSNPHLWKTVAQQGFPSPQPPTSTGHGAPGSSVLQKSPVPAALPSQAPGSSCWSADRWLGLGRRVRGVGEHRDKGTLRNGAELSLGERRAAPAEAGLAEQAFEGLASKPETLGQNRPKWATSPIPQGKSSLSQ